jgi:hypothetical protein
MKIKGLRWYIIGLIMMITIINYLDRGTLNYMWVANIDYELVEKQPIDMSSNVAVKTDKGYRLFSTRGDDMIVDEGSVTIKQKDAATIVTNKEGIAIDLGLIDRNDPDASKNTIKRIWKQSVLKDFQLSQYIKLENGYSAHVYDMEVIIAIALQMDTYQALLFRQWFISKVVNRKDCHAEQVKHEYPMIIVMNGTMPRGAS